MTPARLTSPLRNVSLRLRVGLLVGLAVGLTVAVASAAAFITVRQQLHSQRDAALVARAQAASQGVLSNPEVIAAIPPGALGAVDIRVGLLGADGKGLRALGAASPPFHRSELEVARGQRSLALLTATIDSKQFRVVAVPAGNGRALVLAQKTDEIEDTLDRLGLVLLLVGLVGVAVAASSGVAIARAGLRPVEELTVAAENVAATQRLEPIEVRGSDEIARLAVAFNAMLVALASSRDRQRALVADAGHELRTPLTSLRTNLDLLAQSERSRAAGGDGVPAGGLSAAERDELLTDVRAQVGELSALVGDLVELAREEPPAASPEPVHLEEVVARAAARVERRASQVRFRTHCEPWVVTGDPAILERAVTNLLDNAAKWSPRDGMVSTSLVDGLLRVVDEGPGIAPEDLPHVFERFYRSPEGRGLPGSGLGLAIVKHAVEGHGGTVEAAPAAAGGTVMTVRLPGVRPGDVSTIVSAPDGSSALLGPVSDSSQS